MCFIFNNSYIDKAFHASAEIHHSFLQCKQDSLAILFLLRLTFVDPEYRVNKKGMDFGQMTINRNLLPSTVYPTTPCMLNWHNASLEKLSTDWLIAACLQVNQRLRTSRFVVFCPLPASLS